MNEYMMVLMVREREFHNTKLNNKTQLQHLLGEKRDCILLAAIYIDAGHKKRQELTNQ